MFFFPLVSGLLWSSAAPPSVWCGGGSAGLACSRRPRRGGEARATEEAAAGRATRGRFPLIPPLPSCLQFHNCRFPWSGRQSSPDATRRSQPGIGGESPRPARPRPQPRARSSSSSFLLRPLQAFDFTLSASTPHNTVDL